MLLIKLKSLMKGPGDANRGGDDRYPGSGEMFLPLAPPRFGLGIFLIVVTMVFSISVTAYIQRMNTFGDWRPLPEPGLLWFNTAILIISSIALEWARQALRNGNIEAFKPALLAAGVLAIAFIVGQLWAWQQLVALGYYMVSNPANSFFYLLTALHGVHLCGGIVAWGVTSTRVWNGCELSRIRNSVDLCAIYWHFLLILWIVLFGLMLST